MVAVVPSYVDYYDGNSTIVKKELDYNVDASEKGASSGIEICDILFNNVIVYVPNQYTANDIKVYYWQELPAPAKYVEKECEFVEDSDVSDIPNGYKAYRCSDERVNDGIYLITINNKQ